MDNTEIRKVCSAMVVEALEYDIYLDMFTCRHCDESVTYSIYQKDNINHLPDCPVLTARKLLRELV